MSFHLLLQHYHNGHADKFCALLSGANGQYPSRGFGGQSNGHMGGLVGSPSGYGTSPRMVTKNRKVSGQAGNAGKGVTRAEVNGRDHAGLTILHRAVSDNAIAFAMALIDHNATDLYIQDTENGWTALHRALYFGNITLAQALMDRDSRDPTSQSLIKVKDHEGNSPFDLYNATIARRTLNLPSNGDDQSDEESQDENEISDDSGSGTVQSLDGDEVFAWGSSRNHGLGFKDQDDRKNPERITLTRPEHLLFRFYREYLETLKGSSEPSSKRPFPKSVFDLPTLIENRPIVIQDVALSKLHSAILTTDPESNLYMCGFGPGGRLGTGDETTRFSYIPIDEGSLAGKQVAKIALGQNHTVAVTSDGSLHSWGTNSFGQLGYTLPRPALKDEEPVSTTPRQIFGTMKREDIIGVAASAIHSVAHTSTSLYTWGKNEGQLGLMDSDSRSLDVQPVPRKVAASLFKAPIKKVSAINGATIILLANHSLFVFSNYGYNLVKFPQESFSNYHLKTMALTTRYDSASIHISDITAGGDTIGAISSRGDLFTITLRKPDVSTSASTTNPSKIKDSLSAPQRVWALRKGNWDGVKSAGIAENGSVVVCTQAGAVWRRIERANIRNTSTGTGGRKEFKFQRVPGLSKVTAIRSTPFGVFTAIRKDCDVTRTQVLVQDQSLWKDVAPLLSISNLEASSRVEDDSADETAEPRFWKPMMPVDLFEPLKRAVLTSADLEADVSQLLNGQSFTGCNLDIGTSLSEVKIPVHGFMLGRSPVLRKIMDVFRTNGSSSIPDVLEMTRGATSSSQSIFSGETFADTKPCLIFQGLDFIALVNLLVYLYTDEVIDVWHFTRQSPRMAFRYRQIRVEMMKLASHLKLDTLETAVRLMIQPEKQLNGDLSLALRDPAYTDDGDTILELDGDEIMVHSAILCQRCPFFEGLFNGRAGGQWLAGRRQNNSEPVRIDLKHMDPTTFNLVLRYLYADVGTELFDDVVCADIDEFSELVMDVMAAANELMLDRLSQICQQIIGRFVTSRNVSGLLNTIAPCSEKAFKHSALEYICLQLESMLENHLLYDLDEDLFLELDDVVKANQLNCLPFAKSGRAELLLHERYPDLAEDTHEEKQRRLRDVAFRMNLKEEEFKLSNSFRARIGSVDDSASTSPGHEKSRRKSKQARNAPFSPSLRPKDFSADLMFDMDEENTSIVGSPDSPSLRPMLQLPRTRNESSSPAWNETEPRSMPDIEAASFPPITPNENTHPIDTPPSNKKWSSPALSSSKLDMREIMAQASATRTSALSMSISAQIAKDEAVRKQAAPKLSQKERKKQQQNILQQALNQSQKTPDPSDSKPSSPWQVATGSKTSLKDVFEEPALPSPAQSAKTLAPPVAKPLTPRRTASPDTRFPGQSRSNSASNSNTQIKLASRPSAPSKLSSSSSPAMPQSTSTSSPIIPHSKSYKSQNSRAEPTLLLSMEDIIGLQRREQEVIADAVKKRSLQEIQEEQAFQEWWDAESRRAREEEEAVASAKASSAKTGGGSANRGKSSGGRGKGGRGRGGGEASKTRGGGEVARGRGGDAASRGRVRGGAGASTTVPAGQQSRPAL